MEKVETLTAQQIAFEIRFALGQAGATLFVSAHSKSPEVRLKAMEALTAVVAARFDTMTVTRELPANTGPLFGSGR